MKGESSSSRSSSNNRGKAIQYDGVPVDFHSRLSWLGQSSSPGYAPNFEESHTHPNNEQFLGNTPAPGAAAHRGYAAQVSTLMGSSGIAGSFLQGQKNLGSDHGVGVDFHTKLGWPGQSSSSGHVSNYEESHTHQNINQFLGNNPVPGAAAHRHYAGQVSTLMGSSQSFLGGENMSLDGRCRSCKRKLPWYGCEELSLSGSFSLERNVCQRMGYQHQYQTEVLAHPHCAVHSVASSSGASPNEWQNPHCAVYSSPPATLPHMVFPTVGYANHLPLSASATTMPFPTVGYAVPPHSASSTIMPFPTVGYAGSSTAGWQNIQCPFHSIPSATMPEIPSPASEHVREVQKIPEVIILDSDSDSDVQEIYDVDDDSDAPGDHYGDDSEELYGDEDMGLDMDNMSSEHVHEVYAANENLDVHEVIDIDEDLDGDEDQIDIPEAYVDHEEVDVNEELDEAEDMELQDMELDIDNMSYEELLALGDLIGNVNVGLSVETINTHIRFEKYSSFTYPRRNEQCSICQEDYVEAADVGELDCRHDYHYDCIAKWLKKKNSCPICKEKALSV